MIQQQHNQQWLWSSLVTSCSTWFGSLLCINSDNNHLERCSTTQMMHDSNTTIIDDHNHHDQYNNDCIATSTSTTTVLQQFVSRLPILLLQIWIIIEILFLLYFYVILLPKANQPVRNILVASSSSTTTSNKQQQEQQQKKKIMMNPYRAPYHEHKHLLLRRIIYRMLNDNCKSCNNTNDNNNSITTKDNNNMYDPILVQQVMTNFIMSWFHQQHNESKTDRTTTTSSQRSETCINSTNQRQRQLLLLPSCCESSISTDTTTPPPLSNNSCNSSSNSSDNEEEEEEEISVSSSEDLDTSTTRTTTTGTFVATSKSNITIKDTQYWTIPHISKQNGMNDFLSWSMFNVHYSEMSTSDKVELEKCYNELQSITSLFIPDDDNEIHSYDNHTNTINHKNHNNTKNCTTSNNNNNNGNGQSISSTKTKGSSSTMKSKRLSLEYVNAWHRPLLLYGIIYLIRTIFTKCILQYCFQFQRIRSSNGVTGWYRRGRSTSTTTGSSGSDSSTKLGSNNDSIPIIFFHGIAPGGVFFYIPMLLFGKNSILSTINKNSNRCIMLIDNMNISLSSISMFDALSEQEMIQGIEELVHTYIPNPTTTPLAVCGHSFGSCIISWLLNHSTCTLRNQIQLVILLDPVTILLSEPNVMNNFLYSYKILSCIGMVASSELFTEYYLRHHFAWYNSELWLDELLLDNPIHHDHQHENTRHQPTINKNKPYVVIALSETDEIVDAPKVKRHIDLFQERHLIHQSTISSMIVDDNNDASKNKLLRTIYWRNVGHADCLRDPNKWYDVQQEILDCEYHIMQCKKVKQS